MQFSILPFFPLFSTAIHDIKTCFGLFNIYIITETTKLGFFSVLVFDKNLPYKNPNVHLPWKKKRNKQRNPLKQVQENQYVPNNRTNVLDQSKLFFFVIRNLCRVLGEISYFVSKFQNVFMCFLSIAVDMSHGFLCAKRVEYVT